ncbi:protein of unknown function [Tenacibaculum sp. 190524A02b]|uniref:hypothetical protein n=1 Tax=Tenacibaculum vairaonense TaxID=3137860 RepID=UPI0032B1EF04
MKFTPITFDPNFLKGEEDSTMLAHFCYHARGQGWSEQEIDNFIRIALNGDDDHLFNMIKENCRPN